MPSRRSESESKLRAVVSSSMTRALNPSSSGWTEVFGASTALKTAVKVTALPLPGLLSIAIWPRIRWTNRWLITRPRPVPPNLRVIEPSAWVKAWKSWSMTSCSIPVPVSVTWKRKPMVSSTTSQTVAETVTLPHSVNLIALLTRLNNTWPSRMGSPRRDGVTPGSISTCSFRFFSSACAPIVETRPSKTSSSRNSICSSWSLSTSALVKSRISLTIWSRERPLCWVLLR